ncbi:MAG: DNA repair protein RecN, partial [Desulfohalobiaceae bacterium]
CTQDFGLEPDSFSCYGSITTKAGPDHLACQSQFHNHMLEFLRIKNLGLIHDLELEFSPGLNVISGESGAGKSFILRALDFVLGEKISSSLISPGQDKAVVEAVFNREGEEYILRRELSSQNNRSRFFLNDHLSSQNKAKELKPELILHTSQHSQQRLLEPSYHKQLLDSWLEHGLLQEKKRLSLRLRDLDHKKSSLQQQAKELEEKRDFLQYQQAEIAKVQPKPGEEEELEDKKQALKDQTDRYKSVQQCLEAMYSQGQSLEDSLWTLQKESEKLSSSQGKFQEYAQGLEEARHLLQEMERDLKAMPLPAENEQELERIESRLWELSQLQRRLGRSLQGILELQKEIEDNLSFLDGCHLELQQLEREKQALEAELAQTVQKLNQARHQAADQLAHELQNELQNLGFDPDLQVTFQFQAQELRPGIQEDIPRLMWVPNPGHPSQPLEQIASGGELSRFLLALVSLSARQSLPTLLFDEVDAGIGGMVLDQVGSKLQSLARRQQIILVSHWPQLACLAHCHFKVQKLSNDDVTYTSCSRLQSEEILQELSRMAGGGEKGHLLARQLLQEQNVGAKR